MVINKEAMKEVMEMNLGVEVNMVMELIMEIKEALAFKNMDIEEQRRVQRFLLLTGKAGMHIKEVKLDVARYLSRSASRCHTRYLDNIVQLYPSHPARADHARCTSMSARTSLSRSARRW